MDNLACTVHIKEMPSLHPALHLLHVVLSSFHCCCSDRSAYPHHCQNCSFFFFFFEKPSGFVSVTRLSFSPLKMIDRSGKSSAQLLSLSHLEEIERSSKRTILHQKTLCLCSRCEATPLEIVYNKYIAFFSPWLCTWKISALQMKTQIRGTFCIFWGLQRSILQAI